MQKFDIAFIGGGPAGYIGAIRAAQLGFTTAIIDKVPVLGGTCLRVGCIPSKAMLDSSELFEQVAHGAEHGVIAEPKLDLETMLSRKAGVVDQLTKGIAGLMKKNKVTHFTGTGTIEGPGKVAIAGESNETIEVANIIVATGSEPTPLPPAPLDHDVVVDSTGALNFKSVPEKLVVIGGGAIGLELGSVWSRLGAEVTVVEFLDRIAPFADAEMSKALTRSLKKQGLKFALSSKVTDVEVKDGKATVTFEDKKGTQTLEADKVLVAVGRRPYTEGLGLDKVGVSVDERGRIPVDPHYRAADGVYAVGDVIAGPMLAHKAEEDAVTCVEMIAGQKPHFDYDLVPSVVYTHPELACVGKTEEALKEEGRAYNKGTFPFMANGRAKAAASTDGMVKVLADKETDEVLGVHIVGPRASDLIAEAVLTMEYRGSAEDIGRTCHAHPTFAEATKQAALDALGRVLER